MKPVIYVGLSREGAEIAESGQWAEYHVPIEVDDELADRLLQQPGNWQRPTAKSPAAGSVDDVLARVGDDPAKASAALTAERARSKPRKTLVSALEAIAGMDDTPAPDADATTEPASTSTEGE